jgi:hypothetical protein
MTKHEIIGKTLKDMHSSADPTSPEYEENVVARLRERVPDGNSRTCEDFAHLGVECCETCHTFMAHSDMYAVDLPEGGKAWICCAVRSELFPETRVDTSDRELKLFYWMISGRDVRDYAGYLSPELLREMSKAGLLNKDDDDDDYTNALVCKYPL